MKYKMLLPVLLTVMMLLSWYTLFTGGGEADEEFAGYLSQARGYMEDGLTEYGFEYYGRALALKDSVELRLEIAERYRTLGMEKEHREWCEQILEAFPNDAASYDTMMKIYLESNSYSSCFSLLKTAAARGVTSEFLQATSSEIAYKYRLSGSYAEVKLMSQGVYAARRGSYWGFINGSGAEVIEFGYQEADSFTADGVAPVTDEEGNEFYIDTKGRKAALFKQDYTELGCRSGGVAAVKRADGMYVYVDPDGNELSEAYDEAFPINSGIGVARLGDAWYIIGPSGAKLSETAFEAIKLNENGVAYMNERIFLKQNGSWAMFDASGGRIGSTVFEDVKVFASGSYTAVKIADGWAFIGKDGNLLSDKRYEDARPFSSGLAAVKTDGKWGFVNSSETVVIEAEFDDARDFNSSGGCFVCKEERWSLLRLYRIG